MTGVARTRVPSPAEAAAMMQGATMRTAAMQKARRAGGRSSAEQPWPARSLGMDDEPITILLVEDSQTARVIAQNWLESGLAIEFDLITRKSLHEAVEVLSEQKIDVAILDLNLPDSRGLETFRRVVQSSPEVPVVILSGEAEQAVAVAAVREGAQDYIVKTDSAGTHHLARSVQFAIERVRRQRAEASLLATQQQLSIAREIQQQLFPPSEGRFEGVEVIGRCDPADQAGGDYYDYFSFSDGSLGIVLGDVSGHGIGPAMVMVETRAVLRTLARTELDAGHILTLLNEALASDICGNSFVTLFFGRLDPRRRSLQYASAGHRGFLLHRQDSSFEILQSENLPLGISEHEQFDTLYADLCAGDTVFLFTDGLSESTQDDEHLLGDERVVRAAAASREQGGRVMIESVFQLAESYSRPGLQTDDRTAVVLQVSPEAPVPGPDLAAVEKRPQNRRSSSPAGS